MSSVVYAREFDLPVDDYIRVVGDSTLGPGRPLDDRERVARMIRGADLIVSARIDGECVGIGRCLTDFSWVAYLGDLAVSAKHQGKGIGKGLLLKLKDELGPEVGMSLLSVPEARSFYDTAGQVIGLTPYDAAYFMPRAQGVSRHE